MGAAFAAGNGAGAVFTGSALAVSTFTGLAAGLAPWACFSARYLGLSPFQLAQLAQVLERLPGDPAATRLLERVAEARALPAEAPWQPAVALDKL